MKKRSYKVKHKDIERIDYATEKTKSKLRKNKSTVANSNESDGWQHYFR